MKYLAVTVVVVVLVPLFAEVAVVLISVLKRNLSEGSKLLCEQILVSSRTLNQLAPHELTVVENH